MPLSKIRELGQWPYCKNVLTDTVPEELLSLVIGGISEYLEAPIVLIECTHSPKDGGPLHAKGLDGERKFIYPKRMSANGERDYVSTYRYPRFCKEFRESFEGAGLLCDRDSVCRGYEVLTRAQNNKLYPPSPQKCHLGLNVFMECISYLDLKLAVCTSGKFIQAGEEEAVVEKLQKYKAKLPDQRIKELVKWITEDAHQRDMAKFANDFHDSVSHLTNMIQSYFDTHREKKEWECQELINQILYSLPNKIGDFSTELEQILSTLKDTLSVKYLALFFADSSGGPVLPLTAQSGLRHDLISSVHFNWRKAGIPNGEEFKLLDWLAAHNRDHDFPKMFLEKGIKGQGEEYLQTASYMIPYGREYRGILLIGPWNQDISSEAASRGKDFIQSIGHLLMANALSKRAMAVSLQHDRRRDSIVAMTAHSIKQALQRLLNFTSLVKGYNQITDPSIISVATDRMDKIVRTMSKNVNMAMSAPETAILPDLSVYEMEIESINIAALLNSCADSLELYATSKQIKIHIDDNIENLTLIFGDRYMLQLMFSNIIDNAIKYSRPQKEVRIYASLSSVKSAKITIEDFGYEISQNDIGKIFEANYQGQAKDKKIMPRGIGLGLFQAQQFARLHKGNISVTSSPISGDTQNHLVRFTVELPADKVQEKR